MTVYNTVNSIKELEPEAEVLEGLHIGSSSASNSKKAVSDWLGSLGETVGSTEHMEDNSIKITAGDTTFTATLADNSSVEALKELLDAFGSGDVTVTFSLT